MIPPGARQAAPDRQASRRDNGRDRARQSPAQGRAAEEIQPVDKQPLDEPIDLIGTSGLGDPENKARDLLGRVYAYFLAQFASAEGKKGRNAAAIDQRRRPERPLRGCRPARAEHEWVPRTNSVREGARAQPAVLARQSAVIQLHVGPRRAWRRHSGANFRQYLLKPKVL